MKIVFWIAYALTIAEFIASPVNTLNGSKIHLQRLREVHFPLTVARYLAVIELAAVAGLIAGLWVPITRQVGGFVLAGCFVPLIVWAIRAKREVGDILGLAFFIACALVVALY